jgi:hypothetical protein
MPKRVVDVRLIIHSVEEIKSDLDAVIAALNQIPAVNIDFPGIPPTGPQPGQILTGRSCEGPQPGFTQRTRK